ncbi:MAG: galactokinase [Ruminococcaceae bacterium]|nr:galactokinase [Oscillospiraceae bacterium]
MELNAIIDRFLEIYGGTKEDLYVFESPGRVNLIGEHTDYNGGYVFPAALTMKTTIVARKRNDQKIVLRATDLEDVVEADISNLADYKDLWWGNYQIGVAYEMQNMGYDIVGVDVLYDDTVPHGSGLSSSAAIEVSTALMFATLHNEKKGITEDVDMVEMAKISQMAEHHYIGVKCGIMDQFTSAMGKKDCAILLNCIDLTYEYAHLDLKGKKLVISNTNKKHKLGDSKYNERRGECDSALEALKGAMPDKTCLAEISPEEFEAHKHLINNDIVRNRAEHVIYEIDRTVKSVEALKNGDIELFGKYMNQSHDSLMNLYEVSCKELDTLVFEARKIDGVLGSRMTGAGFGGSTVSVVEETSVEEFIEKVGKAYTEICGLKADFYVTDIGDGGHRVFI